MNSTRKYDKKFLLIYVALVVLAVKNMRNGDMKKNMWKLLMSSLDSCHEFDGRSEWACIRVCIYLRAELTKAGNVCIRQRVQKLYLVVNSSRVPLAGVTWSRWASRIRSRWVLKCENARTDSAICIQYNHSLPGTCNHFHHMMAVSLHRMCSSLKQVHLISRPIFRQQP